MAVCGRLWPSVAVCGSLWQEQTQSETATNHPHGDSRQTDKLPIIGDCKAGKAGWQYFLGLGQCSVVIGENARAGNGACKRNRSMKIYSGEGAAVKQTCGRGTLVLLLSSTSLKLWNFYATPGPL